MLILLIRVIFVLLCLFVGDASAGYFYDNLFGGSLPAWIGASLGFSVGITLIAAEIAFRRRFTRSLVALLIGLAGGLLLSLISIQLLKQAVANPQMARQLAGPLALICCYLVVITVLRHVDRFRLILPFVEFHRERFQEGALVIDDSALRDSRLLALIASGIIGQRLIVHQDLLRFIEQQATNEDSATRVLGKRALDNLADLRGQGERVEVSIDPTEIAGASSLSETLIGMARLESGRLLSNNAQLTSRARGENVPVVYLGDLSKAFAQVIRVGETIEVVVEKAGEEAHQGVGHLDDGSMVIIATAADRIGEKLRCVIVRTLKNANGRMVFCQMLDQNDQPISA
jgi:uncharacterized protein YacL